MMFSKIGRKFTAWSAAFFNSKIALGITAIVLIGVGFALAKGSDKNYDSYVIASKDYLNNSISVSGKVVPREEVALGFDASGKISEVRKNAGDRISKGEVIARLDGKDINADLLKAQADLDAEVAVLNELRTTSGGDAEQVRLANQKLIDSLQDAYTTANDAVFNKVDQVYENTTSNNPKIIFAFDDYELREDLNDERAEITYLFRDWKLVNDGLAAEDLNMVDVSRAKDYLAQVRTFVDHVSVAVNQFEETSNLSQATIDKYKTDISSARTSISASVSDITTAEENTRDITSDIPFQEARVKAAQATVANYRAQLDKLTIVAPFSGVITKQDAKVGQIVSASDELVSLITDASLEIETYIPEVYISNVTVGREARITLDAYGSDVQFDAAVTYVDPAETERDGVSTYKVKLEFKNADERIKPGMTANAVIATGAPESMKVYVPAEAVAEDNTVQVQVGETITTRSVSLGEPVDDLVEITSGLSIGETVVYRKK